MIGTFWYSTVSRNIVCYYCWQWRAETKPEEDIFFKPYCSSLSGLGSLCSLASSKVARMNYITQTCQSWTMRGEQVSNLSQARKCCYFSTGSFPFLTLPSTFLLPYTETEKKLQSNKTKLDKTEKKKPEKKPQQKHPKTNKTKAPKSPYPEG